MTKPFYIDDYSACEETHSTLRIYHDTLPPDMVTSRLELTPSDQVIKGVVSEGKKRKGKVNGWFLDSEGKVESRDSRRHIDWLLDHLTGKEQVVCDMVRDGFQIDIFSFWISATGNGGPTLSPFQMERLAKLQIEVAWDVYFSEKDESD